MHVATTPGAAGPIDGPINEPRGVQTPHIPLWLGGGGEKVTLKLVAKYANGCNVGGGNPEVIRQKLAVLRSHCEQLGRDYNTIDRSTGLTIHLIEPGDDPEKATAQARTQSGVSYEEYVRGTAVGTPDQIVSRIEQIAAADINYLIVYFPRIAYDHTMLHRFAQEVMPRFT